MKNYLCSMIFSGILLTASFSNASQSTREETERRENNKHLGIRTVTILGLLHSVRMMNDENSTDTAAHYATFSAAASAAGFLFNEWCYAEAKKRQVKERENSKIFYEGRYSS